MRVAAVLLSALLLVSCSLSGRPTERPFERWLTADSARAEAFGRFEALLAREGVADVVESYQLWRTDRIQLRCVTEPFSMPPEEMWPSIVPALRFIRDYVKPALGDVEVMSAYRDPEFNACVHGAPASAHRSFEALDMIPIDGRIDRADLIARLCPIHASDGARRGIGLGIYQARRFHIDARSYRGWGEDFHRATFPCNDTES